MVWESAAHITVIRQTEFSRNGQIATLEVILNDKNDCLQNVRELHESSPWGDGLITERVERLAAKDKEIDGRSQGRERRIKRRREKIECWVEGDKKGEWINR